MLFTSYEFIGLVALTLVLYYALPTKVRPYVLLLASYVFYLEAGLICVAYIVATTVMTFVATTTIGRLVAKRKAYLHENRAAMSREEIKSFKDSYKRRTKRVMLLGILFNLGLLAVVKYTNFTIANVNSVLSLFGSETQLSFPDMVMPMGISFYVFQSVGYIVDVYREAVEPEKNFFKTALFVSFFPQLVQGPISRFADLAPSLLNGNRFNADSVRRGFERVLWGFFKKMVIADRILVGVNAIIREPDSRAGAYVFAGMLFYAVELYADFTGGIDITIGIAEMFGVTVRENFERPFFSKNITEYWRRWHITMGTWFTDYIFYPITVSRPMLKLSKSARRRLGEKIGKRVPVYLSSFTVWFATGIWHGASWNFIVWGLLNFVVIMISQELEPCYKRFHARFKLRTDSFGYKSFAVTRTVLLMSALRLLDCYRDVPLTFRMFGTMFTEWNFGVLFDGSMLTLGLSIVDYVIICCGILLMFTVSMLSRAKSFRDTMSGWKFGVRAAVVAALFVTIILFGAYGPGYDAGQFIYNQF